MGERIVDNDNDFKEGRLCAVRCDKFHVYNVCREKEIPDEYLRHSECRQPPRAHCPILPTRIHVRVTFGNNTYCKTRSTRTLCEDDHVLHVHVHVDRIYRRVHVHVCNR